MPLVVFLPLLIFLGLALVPVWLLRRHGGAEADTFVSGRNTSPATIRNASIAHVLRVALFGPVFVLGAQGDLWPVLIAAAGLGAGIALLFLLRRPIFDFLAGALAEGQSITLHAFVARLYNGDRRLRLAAASLTLLMLAALIAIEAFALSGFLTLVFGNDIVGRVLTLVTLALAALYAFPAGQPGTTHAGQWQLAAIFFGLFGAVAVLIYLHVSALTPLPPQAMFAILFAAVFCIALLIYRHSRYLDTGMVTDTRAAKWLGLFGKILNPVISIMVVLIGVLALMEFFATGFSTMATGSLRALQADTSLPLIALWSLALLPLFQPLTDLTNWQRLAAMEINKKSFRGDDARWRAALRHFFRIYAVESVLFYLLIASLGAIAAAATGATGTDFIRTLLQALASSGDEISITAVSLLLVAVFAMGLAAMSAAFSAALCTIGQDIQPDHKRDDGKSTGPRLFVLAVIVALALLDTTLRIDFSGTAFLALVIALGAPALAFAPLVLGPMMTGRTINPDWALGILAVGAASTIGAVVGFAASGNATWLWAAAPVCLGGAVLVFAAALFAQGKRMR